MREDGTARVRKESLSGEGELRWSGSQEAMLIRICLSIYQEKFLVGGLGNTHTQKKVFKIFSWHNAFKKLYY